MFIFKRRMRDQSHGVKNCIKKYRFAYQNYTCWASNTDLNDITELQKLSVISNQYYSQIDSG